MGVSFFVQYIYINIMFNLLLVNVAAQTGLRL